MQRGTVSTKTSLPMQGAGFSESNDEISPSSSYNETEKENCVTEGENFLEVDDA